MKLWVPLVALGILLCQGIAGAVSTETMRLLERKRSAEQQYMDMAVLYRHGFVSVNTFYAAQAAHRDYFYEQFIAVHKAMQSPVDEQESRFLRNLYPAMMNGVEENDIRR